MLCATSPGKPPFGGVKLPLAVSMSGSGQSDFVVGPPQTTMKIRVLRPQQGKTAFPVEISEMKLANGDTVNTTFEAAPTGEDGTITGTGKTTKGKPILFALSLTPGVQTVLV